jgi:hypothetical protein
MDNSQIQPDNVNELIDYLPNFTISSNYEIVMLGNSIKEYTIQSHGGNIDSFSITPELEDGLIFDTSTGIITGTPKKIYCELEYTITATNSYGSSSKTFTIEVIRQSLPNFYMPHSSEYVISGEPIKGNQNILTRTSIDCYYITPTLKKGLQFDSSTGSITGTVITTDKLELKYCITAVNSFGICRKYYTIYVITPEPNFTISPECERVLLGNSIIDYKLTACGNPIDSFSIAPTIEGSGLSFDTSTGIISGTPTSIDIPKIYTITATNSFGSSSKTFTIDIITIKPNFTISNNFESVFLGDYIVGYTIDSTGGLIDSFSINPPLANGLYFDTTRGIISGMVTSIDVPMNSYTITAVNTYGNSSVTFSINIIKRPPNFTISSNSESVILDKPIIGYTINSTGGLIDSFSITPVLENGLHLDTSTGIITGTVTSSTKINVPITYTITGTNSSGVATATYTIILPPTPFTVDSCLNILETSFQNAEQKKSKITSELLNMNCGYVTKFRHFLNNLLNNEKARYLEIGNWDSSCLSFAMCNNKANIVCIEHCFPNSRDPISCHENCIKNSNTFYTNIEKFIGENTFKFIDTNYFSIDISMLPKSNIFMYDGDKYHKNIRNALIYFYNCLEDIFIFIINSHNYIIDSKSFSYIRDNVKSSINILQLKKLYEEEIDFFNDDLSQKNTFYITILQK